MFCFEEEGCPRIFDRWGYVLGGYIYKGCKTAVLVHGEKSNSLSVKVGIHQGSTLSTFLFIMVMDVLTEDVRNG